MDKLPNMVDMSASNDRQAMPAMENSGPSYPYGLAIRLDHNSIEKLGVDLSDVSVGEMFHLFCLAKVTSKNENEGGCCLEMQITNIGVESEDKENEEAEKEMEHEEGEEESEPPKKKGRPNYYFG